MDATFVATFFGALFAIMNPFTVLPVFLSLTEDATPAEQRAIAVKATIYVSVIAVIAALVGSQILRFFGLSVHDLQVAGGLVVLGIAFSMLHGTDNSSHHGSQTEKQTFPEDNSVAFYPLAFPLIVGPGTLTTLILFAGQAKGAVNWIAYFAVLAAVIASVGIVLSLGSRFGKYLTGSAKVIMSRVMGLILAGIAVEMIVAGLKILLPGLAGAAG